jgi:hypothetical protein
MKYDKWEIAFKRATNGDTLKRFRIIGWLRTTETDLVTDAHEAMYAAFASILTRIDVPNSGDLPFSMAAAFSSAEGARAAYETWLALDEDFTDACYRAIEETKRPVNPALSPEPLPDDAKKKTAKSD